jgi:hypothetical protein
MANEKPIDARTAWVAVVCGVLALAFALIVQFDLLRPTKLPAGFRQEWAAVPELATEGLTRQQVLKADQPAALMAPATGALVIRFPHIDSVKGLWAGESGTVLVAEGPLAGSYPCASARSGIDWGDNISARTGGAGFEADCSVRLPITEALLGRTVTATVSLDVRYPRMVGDLAFRNDSDHLTRTFALHVVRGEQIASVVRYTTWNQNDKPSSKNEATLLFVVAGLLLLALGGGALIVRRKQTPQP